MMYNLIIKIYHVVQALLKHFRLCWDYIKKYSRPIEFLYFYRPINIILITLKTKLADFLNQTQNFTIGRSSADTSADDKW